MENLTISVAVIIPTIGNPLLENALNSVLSQTYSVTEIIVVADVSGPIEIPKDERIKVIHVGPRAGGNVARQAGISEAKSEIVALLDDDDEWLPNKIETQLNAVSKQTDVHNEFWLSSCRIRIKKPNHPDILVPERLCEAGHSLTNYLFKRNGVKSTHGFIQSSAMMFPRSMALKVQFDGTLRYHQDIAWIVDVSNNVKNLIFVQCGEGLVIKNSIDASVSKTITSDRSISWAKHRLSDDPRLLGDFILTQSLLFAKNSGSLKNMIHTIANGLRLGAPGIPAILYSVLTTLKMVFTRSIRIK